MSATTTVVVLAKAPVAGRVKTRLCPPCTPDEAAVLAAAALGDTLHAVGAARVDRRVLALDGAPAREVPAAFRVVAQCGGGLDRRLAHALGGHPGPTVLVGMDTPQLRPGHLEGAVAALTRPGVDAVLGPALDGGYWAIGLRDPARAADALLGIPMSTARTARAQRRRLDRMGLVTAELGVLRDVDRFDDALAVAAEAGGGRFARAVARLVDAGRRAP